MGEFPKIYKRVVENKHAGETSCKKLLNMQDFYNRYSVMITQFEIQLSMVLKESKWFFY